MTDIKNPIEFSAFLTSLKPSVISSTLLLMEMLKDDKKEIVEENKIESNKIEENKVEEQKETAPVITTGVEEIKENKEYTVEQEINVKILPLFFYKK